MTKTYEFFKEDIEREENDSLLYLGEKQKEIEEEFYAEQRKKHTFASIVMGKPRYRNRKTPIKYAKIRLKQHNPLPF